MRRVLVVEDEALILLTVIDALEDAGFEVIEASTADDAVEIINEHTIHFLFTDIQMPGELSGVDLAHVVAERFPEAGIIVASGRLTPGDVNLPADAQFFSKPYDFATVVDRLKEFRR
ncbi:response regulator [Neorhizobium vignae]|uniref:response regulator n=1 Tax=Neorhizobium vignae TaxID=690585 RepID=UPI00056D983E|nr:response regulator [Neorhizobium vignae]